MHGSLTYTDGRDMLTAILEYCALRGTGHEDEAARARELEDLIEDTIMPIVEQDVRKAGYPWNAHRDGALLFAIGGSLAQEPLRSAFDFAAPIFNTVPAPIEGNQYTESESLAYLAAESVIDAALIDLTARNVVDYLISFGLLPHVKEAFGMKENGEAA